MSTDTAPAAVPGPPEQPGQAATGEQPAGAAGEPSTQGGFLASMVAAVEPARPAAFDLNPAAAGTGEQTGTPDEALDRSAPGVSSASFRDATQDATKTSDPAGSSHKRGVWKELWLAVATRWAKGGGTANKRLDVAKAKAARYQVKENRTTSVMKSGALPFRNTGGSGAGISKGSDKSGSNSAGKGPKNSSGNGSTGAGRGGSGGGRGSGGGAGNAGSGSGGRSPKSPAPTGGSSGQRGTGGGFGKSGSGGSNGAPGTAGKKGMDGTPGNAGPGGTGAGGTSRKHDLTKSPKTKNTGKGKGADGPKAKTAPDGSTGPSDDRKNSTSKNTTRPQAASEKTPLQKSRETGHGDGTKARRVVDHVKAYAAGTRDGWGDEKNENAKEHQRLDKAHTDRKTKAKDGHPKPVIVTEKEDDGVTTDVKPLTVQKIDVNTLTLGTAGARTTVGRRELRNFKQYERKLEEKETVLQRIAEACAQLEKEAENEAKDCQRLAEQAKGEEGGEKLVAALNKLADAAKNQATEAAELAQRARRAAEMCKVVLTNIQTRYAPLYKAVVDSDETKPAEMRFYNDKGSYAPAA